MKNCWDLKNYPAECKSKKNWSQISSCTYLERSFSHFLSRNINKVLNILHVLRIKHFAKPMHNCSQKNGHCRITLILCINKLHLVKKKDGQTSLSLFIMISMPKIFSYVVFLHTPFSYRGLRLMGFVRQWLAWSGVYMSEYVGQSTQGLYFIIFLNGEEANVFCCTLQMR